MLAELMQAEVLVPWILGMVFGIFVGSTPGLTATMAVALIVPFSYSMSPAAGLALIIGVSFTAIFAGDIPATYLRIPGTPASAAATLDGHPLAKQGRGKFALQIDLFCSALGGLLGVGLLILVAPQLARFALRFSSFEYFWLAVLGLSMSALVSQGSLLKGLAAAALGMLLSTIGMDETGGVPRYTFGSVQLMGRLEVIPVMIGLFGMSQVFKALGEAGSLGLGGDTATDRSPRAFGAALLAIWRHKVMMLTSALTGAFIGALPGAGADIAAWGAYGLAERTSRDPSRFGQGAIDGVVAPTSANNAAVAGAWIPALVFGVPGDAVTAIVIEALKIYDIKPGPRIFEQSGPQMNQLFAIALITQLLLIPAGLLGLAGFRQVMRLPRAHVLAAVVVFSIVGSFAKRGDLFDVYLMLAAGVLGWFLEARGVPIAPLVLGLILGPKVEDMFRTGMIASDGSLTPFFTRPLCLVQWLLLLAGFTLPRLLRQRRQAAGP